MKLGACNRNGRSQGSAISWLWTSSVFRSLSPWNVPTDWEELGARNRNAVPLTLGRFVEAGWSNVQSGSPS